MEDNWTRARDALVRAITDLGFPAELGDAPRSEPPEIYIDIDNTIDKGGSSK